MIISAAVKKNTTGIIAFALLGNFGFFISRYQLLFGGFKTAIRRNEYHFRNIMRIIETEQNARLCYFRSQSLQRKRSPSVTTLPNAHPRGMHRAPYKEAVTPQKKHITLQSRAAMQRRNNRDKRHQTTAIRRSKYRFKTRKMSK